MNPAIASIITITIMSCVTLSADAAKAVENKPSSPVVRVCILDDRDSFQLSLQGRYRICAQGSQKPVMEGPYLKSKVISSGSGFKIDGREIKFSRVSVDTIKDSNIYVEKKRFRGSVDIIRKDNGKLMVVNYIPLEQYLYGVLYHEVSHRWPMEALKAQAIAARTFALYQMSQCASQPYDVRSDVYSQVYGGRTGEKWATNKAVDATKGKVLTYDGKIFPAYYHATCAGITEDAGNLWKITAPPLKGGVRCNFCANSPHYLWAAMIPKKEIEEKMHAFGYTGNDLKTVEVSVRNASGRVDKILLQDSSDQDSGKIFSAKDFRQAIGPDRIRSTKFTLSFSRDFLTVEGKGWGHGAGMCQWGAFGMARKGKEAEEILKFYYPGSEITEI